MTILQRVVPASPKNQYARLLAVLGATFLLALLAGSGYNAWRDKQVVYRSWEGAAAPRPDGPATAEAQGRRLLARYRAHNFAFLPFFEEVGLEGLRLPDQGSAETESNRATNTTGWIIPYKDPAFHDVAFYTDNYAFAHITRLRDGTMKSDPGGFYLVVMKNGDINRVPVSQVRLLQTHGQHLYVFPGVDGYSSTLPHAPSYQPVSPHAR